MKTYTTDQLQDVLHLHRLWRRNEEGGSRANLSEAYLRGANLSEADLRGAIFRGSYLSEANFCGADLIGADLRGACLREAYFRGADLRGANFSGADLSEADFSRSCLSEANFCGAYLRGADLIGADLSGAMGLPIATDAPARLLVVAQAALASPDALAMDAWHTCETTHCICGWAEHLGGPLANLIIQTQGNAIGGLMLLGVEAHAHFYSTNEKARVFLQSVIDQAEAVA
jgi:hypothetical protein